MALEYRTEFFIRIVGWSVRLVISLFLWFSVTQAKGGIIAGYDFEKILLYFFLVQIIATFIFNDSGFAINRDIHTGDLSNYLLKPIRYLTFSFSAEFGYSITRAIIGIILFGGIFTAIRPEFFTLVTGEFDRFLIFLVSLIFAMFMNFYLVALIALLAFWVISSQRFLFIYFGILNIFSGIMLPLDLFPEGMLKVLKFLPFPYLFYYPLTIILKPEVSISTFGMKVILPQVVFLIILSLATSLLYHAGLKRYEAVGS